MVSVFHVTFAHGLLTVSVILSEVEGSTSKTIIKVSDC